MHQDGRAFENADGLRAAAIQKCGDFGIGVDIHKAAAELLAFTNADQPGVVFRALVAKRQKLLQQDRHLLAIGRAQRIKLHGVVAHRQFLVMRRAGDGAVDIGKAPAIGLVPGPDFRGGVIAAAAHGGCSLGLAEAGAIGGGAQGWYRGAIGQGQAT